MKKVLKIVAKEFQNQSRDKRELSVISKFDTNIIIMAKGKSHYTSICDGYAVHLRSTRPLGNHNKLIQINRICSLITWAYYARKIKPYCISCHDLIALLIGWLSTWFVTKEKKPILVYDSHEFEIGRNTGGKRSSFAKFIIPKLERFLMNKCAFSIMVNDSIADEIQRIHKLKEKPVVVRNIPNYWTIDESICRKRKQEFCEQLGIPNDTFIIMYHGGITPGRGIETLLLSVQKDNKIAAVILGNGEENYIEKLKQKAKELQISHRVLFHKAIPLNDLWQYVGAADLGMVTVPAICKSYYLMLPNKLFENIQSLTPIIVSDFPETRRIIKGYDIGLCVNPESVDDIVNAIEEMRINKEKYINFQNNLKQAKEKLCWENECKILEATYKKILRQDP